MSIVPKGHQVTTATNSDGTRDVVLVFKNGDNPFIVETLLKDIDRDPMAPDYAQLAAHEPQLASEESADAAGARGPFTPTISPVPWCTHGCDPGCTCDSCQRIERVRERVGAVASVDANI